MQQIIFVVIQTPVIAIIILNKSFRTFRLSFLIEAQARVKLSRSLSSKINFSIDAQELR